MELAAKKTPGSRAGGFLCGGVFVQEVEFSYIAATKSGRTMAA